MDDMVDTDLDSTRESNMACILFSVVEMYVMSNYISPATAWPDNICTIQYMSTPSWLCRS